MQMKLYSLALFSLLMAQKEIPPSQVCAYFTETQVNIAKQVEQIITADLRQHHRHGNWPRGFLSAKPV